MTSDTPTTPTLAEAEARLETLMEFWRRVPSEEAMVALMRKHHPCRLHDGSECEGPTTDCDPGNCRAVRDVIEKEMANVG